MKKKLKIAYVSSQNPLDKRSWSGTHYNIFDGLSKRFSTVKAFTINTQTHKLLGVLNLLFIPIFGKRYNHHHSILYAFIQSKVLEIRLKMNSYDIIFCAAGSTEIAFLNTKIPIIYFSDSSFGQLDSYYDVTKDLLSYSKKESNHIEKRALNKASHIIYPTKWAADFVERFYQIKREKISIIHLGANLDININDVTPKTISHLRPFHILFLGVYWDRKGGDIMLEAYEELLRNKRNVTLTICGCTPPKKTLKTTVIPFLNKNIEEDLRKLQKLLVSTDLLFVPTRAECYGIVFNEANAYGVPVLSTKTGGVPEIIKDNYNGYTLPLSAQGDAYAKKITEIINSPELYRILSENAIKNYNDSNNWESFSQSLKRIIEIYQK